MAAPPPPAYNQPPVYGAQSNQAEMNMAAARERGKNLVGRWGLWWWWCVLLWLLMLLWLGRWRKRLWWWVFCCWCSEAFSVTRNANTFMWYVDTTLIITEMVFMCNNVSIYGIRKPLLILTPGLLVSPIATEHSIYSTCRFYYKQRMYTRLRFTD